MSGATLFALMAIELAPSLDYFEQWRDNSGRVAHGIRQAASDLRGSPHRACAVVFVDGSQVANEYVVNPLATLADVSTYNVGGDRNQLLACELWPDSVRRLIEVPSGEIEIMDVAAVLNDGADAIIFTNFDLAAQHLRLAVRSNEAAFESALTEAHSASGLAVAAVGSATAVTLRPPPTPSGAG